MKLKIDSLFPVRLAKAPLSSCVMLVCLAGFTPAAVGAVSGPTVFLNPFNPGDILVTAQREILLGTSTLDGNSVLGRYNLSGSVLSSKVSTDLFAFGAFAEDPLDGMIWELDVDGDVYRIHPTSLSRSYQFSVRGLTIDVSQVYEVVSGTVQNLGSNILPSAQQTTYGQIAVSRRGGQLRFYVTGNSISVNPFVVRIRIAANGSVAQAEVFLASLATLAPNLRTLRGITVNRHGWLLSSLPTNFGVSAIFDKLYVFHEDLLPARGGVPGAHHGFLFSDDGILAHGVAADPTGNFYVATSRIGSTPCGVGGIIVYADFSGGLCLTLGNQTTAIPRDFAIEPDGRHAYMTVGDSQTLNGAIEFVLRYNVLDLNQVSFSDGFETGNMMAWSSRKP